MVLFWFWWSSNVHYLDFIVCYHDDFGVCHLDCDDLVVHCFSDLVGHSFDLNDITICHFDCSDPYVCHFNDHGVCCFGDLSVCHLSNLDLGGHVNHHVDDIIVCKFHDLHVYHFGHDGGKIKDS